MQIEEIAPLVYTPTVGTVCQQFGFRFSRSRGMYFSSADRGQFHTMVHNWPHDDVHVIVVTDGSRILGLGDLGVHGMGIPIGKLALYCAAGGIAPHRVLPIALDVGTNNSDLLNDPDYVGLKQPRITGVDYFEMLDEFMSAVFSRWPNVVVQFEDFETSKAIPLLEKYRNKYRCFNDDIQGTGSVTLSCILSAAKLAGKEIKDLKFVCAGAGSAGLGVCTQIMEGLVAAGLTREEAHSRFVVCSVNGAIGYKTSDNSPHYSDTNASINELMSQILAEDEDREHHVDDVRMDVRGISRDHYPWINFSIADGTSLEESIRQFKPDVLLGLTACPNIFTENIVKIMAENNERPIIMPMSNPTSRAECTASQAYEWTEGRAIVATGSPFGTVDVEIPTTSLPIIANFDLDFYLANKDNKENEELFSNIVSYNKDTNKIVYRFTPSQCNNMYIFPGIGLACSVAGITSITDSMLYAASVACASTMNEHEIQSGRTFPHIKRIREVAHKVACSVIRVGIEEKLTTKIKERHIREGIEEYVARKMYYPAYVPLL